MKAERNACKNDLQLVKQVASLILRHCSRMPFFSSVPHDNRDNITKVLAFIWMKALFDYLQKHPSVDSAELGTTWLLPEDDDIRKEALSRIQQNAELWGFSDKEVVWLFSALKVHLSRYLHIHVKDGDVVNLSGRIYLERKKK